jgi:hypothetical protein
VGSDKQLAILPQIDTVVITVGNYRAASHGHRAQVHDIDTTANCGCGSLASTGIVRGRWRGACHIEGCAAEIRNGGGIHVNQRSGGGWSRSEIHELHASLRAAALRPTIQNVSRAAVTAVNRVNWPVKSRHRRGHRAAAVHQRWRDNRNGIRIIAERQNLRPCRIRDDGLGSGHTNRSRYAAIGEIHFHHRSGGRSIEYDVWNGRESNAGSRFHHTDGRPWELNGVSVCFLGGIHYLHFIGDGIERQGNGVPGVERYQSRGGAGADFFSGQRVVVAVYHYQATARGRSGGALRDKYTLGYVTGSGRVLGGGATSTRDQVEAGEHQNGEQQSEFLQTSGS